MSDFPKKLDATTCETEAAEIAKAFVKILSDKPVDPRIGLVALGKTIIAMLQALPDPIRDEWTITFMGSFLHELAHAIPGAELQVAVVDAAQTDGTILH